MFPGSLRATSHLLLDPSVVDAAVVLPDEDGLDRPTLVRLAEALRAMPPSLYEHRAGSPAGSRGDGEILEVLFAVLRGCGIRDGENVHALRYLRSVLQGFSSLEASGGFGMRTDLEASYRWIGEALIVNSRSRGRRRN